MNVTNKTKLEEIDLIIDEINTDVFREPNIDNPMMNQNIFELYDDKKAIPTYNNPGVKRL